VTASAPFAHPDRPADHPRERVVDAALRLFAERGFSRVTMRTIGAEVGLHNSTLFHHFRGKGEIAAAVFERVLGRLQPLIEPLNQDDPPSLDHLVRQTLALGDHFLHQPDDARYLLRVILDPDVFVAAYVDALDHGDASNPLVQLLSTVWGWLDRARSAGAIRPVRISQATRNLMGMLLFEPVYGHASVSPQPDEQDRRRHRRIEIESFVRGALAPFPVTGADR
jgi:AcrR family transcriptional regulator